MSSTIGSGSFGRASEGPEKPNNRSVKLQNGVALFGSGLYVVNAPGGKGKSVCSLGILADAVATGWSDAGHIYIFEAGATVYQMAEKRFFADPSAFLDESGSGQFLEYFSDMRGRTSSESLGMIVVDSINDVMRSFSQTKRGGQAASEGGLQPADALFCKTLNNLGVEHSVCILGLVDSNVIPFVPKLEGSCQGIIDVVSASAFSKRDRAGGRQTTQYEVTEKALKQALSIMHYPKRSGEFGGGKDIVTA